MLIRIIITLKNHFLSVSPTPPIFLSYIHRSIVDVETRTKTYLEGYFKELPKNVKIVHRKEWGFDPDAKFLIFIIAIAMIIAAWEGYYFTSKSNEETISYQTKLFKEYEGNIGYLKSKIPVVPAKKKKRRNN